jgi:nucleotide-binding universal stress UspA family protein
MSNANQKPCIVVGVDGSEQSRNALRWAARLAPAMDADIDALAVWHSPALVWGPPPVEFTHPPEEHMKKVLTATVDAVFGANRPRNLRMLVREGHPAELLTGRSCDATMIIVGSRGLGGIKGVLQGSVSRYVSAHASCPVLVVHAAERGQADPVPVGYSASMATA